MPSIKEAIHTGVEKVAEVGQATSDFVADTTQNLREKIAQTPTAVKDALHTTVDKAAEVGQATSDFVADTTQNLRGKIAQTPTAVKDAVHTTVDKTAEAGQNVYDYVAGKTHDARVATAHEIGNNEPEVAAHNVKEPLQGAHDKEAALGTPTKAVRNFYVCLSVEFLCVRACCACEIVWMCL